VADRMTQTKGRACTGKHRHPTRKAALAHRSRLIRLGAAAHRLAVYECGHCGGGWHVGHTRRRRG
jgi:hypothetical protein